MTNVRTPYSLSGSVRYIVSCLRLVILSAFSLLTGCQSADEPIAEAFAMEAWIDSDGYPVVLLTRAVTPSTKPIDVADVMVRWAKVTISDGTDSVVMTGGMDYTVFPPYSYRSYKMVGKVGKTYTVTAEYMGVKAHARSTILPPAQIRSIAFSHVKDSIYSGSLTFEAPETADTCRYVVMTRVRNRDTRHYPAFMGTTTSTSPRQVCEIPLSRGNYFGCEDYSPDFTLGDTVDVILARVEPPVYDFWTAYQNEVYFGHNIFLSAPVVINGNVTDGYGIFSARGTSRQVAVVGE